MAKILNRAWAVLFGATGNTGADWVRPVGIATRHPDASKVFTDADQSVRGWLVEATIQAALLSTYRDRILLDDSVNSYGYALTGETAFFSTTLTNSGVFPQVIDYSMDAYATTIPYVIAVVPGGYTVVSVDGVVLNEPIVTTSRLISLTFSGSTLIYAAMPTSAEGTLEFEVTGKVLPNETPLSIVRKRLLAVFAGHGMEQWPTIELAGWFVNHVIGGPHG